jgi:D-aminopeptidase
MAGRKRIRDYGILVDDDLPTGPRNTIADVAGVRVGHTTLSEGTDIRTGVTAIVPHGGDLFRDKVPAAVHVINGFGKSAGLLQVEELGTLETPILLTNTFGVGACSEALIRYTLHRNEDVGISTGTVNPLVLECNDWWLNDIRGMHVTPEHALAAITAADDSFREGAVGAGTGMSCYKLKGGIGSASRLVRIEDERFTLGVLVLTNMGRLRDLIVGGRRVGREIIARKASATGEPNPGEPIPGKDDILADRDQGSIVVVVATDAPLTARQLRRLARRAGPGISRTGNGIAGDSGEIVLAMSTAQTVRHDEQRTVVDYRHLSEGLLDHLFFATADCTEEAVLNSLVTADAAEGRAGHTRETLADHLARDGKS